MFKAIFDRLPLVELACERLLALSVDFDEDTDKLKPIAHTEGERTFTPFAFGVIRSTLITYLG